MAVQIRERRQYEDRYDHTTALIARIDMKTFLDFRDKWHEQSPENEENKLRNTWHLKWFTSIELD